MTKYQELKSEIDRLLNEIKIIQSACPHKGRQIIPNNREYMQKYAEYWYDIKCLDCGKFWTEEQSKYNNKYGITNG